MLNPAKIHYSLRNTVSTLFHHFGIHCATHQKRVILISSVVITSLFYPALALYSSSNPLSHLSSRFFDTYQSYLREIWEDHDALRVREDGAARARCGMERTLRIERVFITSSEWTPTGAATPSTVRFASQLDDRMRSIISDADSTLSCVRTHDHQCLILSPGLLFDHGIPSVAADVLGAINRTRNITVAGIPIAPSMLLSTRSPVDEHRMLEHVGFLAFTYFFHDNDCLASEGHAKWLSTLEKLASNDLGSTSVAPYVFQKPRFIALQYDPTSSRTSHFSAIPLFLYLSYLIIFVSFSGSLRRMDTVHSRFGLTFTGLIEIMASTVASISVCALAGFRVTMVPWGILPVIIVFVGAENMFILVDAVTSTSITLPVKQRIGTGLAVAGTSNTLKTVAYNSILGTIAFFSSGAIQQFCSFAIVLLVAHWFLIHTFFVAVLSIDLQRLELSDMLSQDKSSKPSVPLVTRKSSNDSPPSKRRRTVSRIKQLLRGRAAKNGSLVMMLAVTATLYYVTYPFPSRPKDDLDPFSFLQHATAVERPANLPGDVPSPAWDIWDTLNPDHDHLVHIRIETPVVVAQNSKESMSDSRRHTAKDRHNYEPTARRPMKLLWLLKILILPIGTTTGCLYLLLLYLLKDAELLEAQRNRPEAFFNPTTSPVLPVASDVKFTTLPRAFATDVELIAANHDASVIAIVSSDDELFLWKEQYHEVRVSDVLTPSSSEVRGSITSVAIDSHGRYCAVGTNTGVVAVWRLNSRGSPDDASPSFTFQASSVVDMTFTPVKPSGVPGPFPSYPSDLDAQPEDDLAIVVVCNNGSATYFNLLQQSRPRTIDALRPEDVLRSRILHTSNHDRICIAFIYSDGTVELCSRCGDDGSWESSCILQPGSPTDAVTELCIEFVDVDDISTLILGTATRSGVVTLWIPTKRECIFVMDDAFGEITRLRISPLHSQPCQKCGELIPDGFSLTFSVGHTVFLHRALLPSLSKRCACAISLKLFPRDVYGRRSRSGSTSSVSSSPMRTRLKLPSASASASIDVPAFPVSGHGVHPRRTASEKDTSRRASETLSVINSHQEDLEFPSIRHMSSRGSLKASTPPNDSVGRGLVVDQIADINCERGGWGFIHGQQLIGLRRRSRLTQDEALKTNRSVSTFPVPVGRGELTASVLEKWEVWTFNLSKPETGARISSLLDLAPSSSPTTGLSLFPRLPFTRISPVIVRPSKCVAGFGNTTGVVDFSHRSRLS